MLQLAFDRLDPLSFDFNQYVPEKVESRTSRSQETRCQGLRWRALSLPGQKISSEICSALLGERLAQEAIAAMAGMPIVIRAMILTGSGKPCRE